MIAVERLKAVINNFTFQFKNAYIYSQAYENKNNVQKGET